MANRREGKVALVAGGGAIVGNAVARELANLGWTARPGGVAMVGSSSAGSGRGKTGAPPHCHGRRPSGLRRSADTQPRKKSSVRNDPVEINAAIREVVDLGRGEATKNDVSARTHLAEGLPPVRGDRVELQQVILNLVVNAIEAMASGEGPRDLTIATARAESGETLVSVRDTGPGLAPAVQENLFKAFHTTKPNGLGLGLSICRSIVEGHSGRLWASANTPRGTVFQFTLPSHLDDASLG